jgi:hypothetical protein
VPNSIAASVGYPQSCADQANNLLVISPGNVVNTALLNIKRGTSFTIKPGNPQQALAPGQFFAVEICPSGCSGGNDYREAIASCLAESAINCLDTYSVKTGNMIGPTKQGVEGGGPISGGGLIGSPSDVWNGFVGNVATFRFQGGGTIVDTSRALVVAPIWDICTTLGADGKLTGTGVQIPVVGFALLFVDGMSGNDVIVHLVDVQGCGTTPVTNETGPFAVPLRLVRTQ